MSSSNGAYLSEKQQ